MSTPAESLLASADEWTRDVLTDSYDVHQTGRLLHGWAQVMASAAAAWDAVPTTPAWQATDIATGTPFAWAALTATQIAADATWRHSRPDHRTAHISWLLDQAAHTIGGQLGGDANPDATQLTRAATLRAGLVYVGYLLTHATATNTTRHAAYLADTNPQLSANLTTISTRIRGIEQTLDAHLHRRPHHAGPPTGIGSLDRTLNNLIRAAYTAQPTAGAATNLLLADIGRTIAGHTARLSILSAIQGRIPSDDVRDRMLPVLNTAVHQWEGSRRMWARMLSPAERPNPQVVAAGIQLQQLLRHPGVADHPAITTSLTTALTIAAELAVLNHRALTDPGLTAPAGAVARLTRDVLDSEPNNPRRLHTWLSMDRIDGPTPVRLPDVLRARLASHGHATLDAALAARSAGNVLTDHSGYHPLLAFHHGHTGPAPRRPEPPPIRRGVPSAPRIG